MTETIAITAHHLYKAFGRRQTDMVEKLDAGASRADVAPLGTAAVIDASFEVRRGEIFVVMGLSGSGKSTLIRMLNGLVGATAGSVTVAGKSITGIPAAELRDLRRSDISMVFQHFALLPHRTVIDNVAYGLEVQGVGRSERLGRAATIIELVGLHGWADSLPSELSGGMQQRVGLARALAADTDVLLMDEAFSALDPLIRREMQEQLIELQMKLGKTIVFITHDLNEAMFLGDRIAVMREGRIVQVGTPEEILTNPADDYVAQFVQDVDRARVLTASSVMEPIGSTDTGAFLADDATSVTAETRLVDLVEPSVESELPIAVVDDENRLLGIIPRVTLLAALGNVELRDAALGDAELEGAAL